MANTLDRNEVKAIVALHEAVDLVAVHGILDLPLGPGRRDVPLETFNPLLGAVGRYTAISISRVVHHFDLVLKNRVDPLGSLIEHSVAYLDGL